MLLQDIGVNTFFFSRRFSDFNNFFNKQQNSVPWNNTQVMTQNISFLNFFMSLQNSDAIN